MAALLGVRSEAAYEGQAAIELEALAEASERGHYDLAWDGSAASPAPLFEALIRDLRANVPVPVMAARFHNSVGALIVAGCRRIRTEQGLTVVALSGGVFQNTRLLSHTLAALADAGFEAHTNQRVPANDGGLALGQAAVAAHKE